MIIYNITEKQPTTISTTRYLGSTSIASYFYDDKLSFGI